MTSMLNEKHLAPGHTVIEVTHIYYDMAIVLAENDKHFVTWMETINAGTFDGHYYHKSEPNARERATQDYWERITKGY